jgi:hypothetical protein
MLSNHTLTKRRVRGAMKTTRKALNRALDAAEPRLEKAAVEIQGIGEDAFTALRKGTRHGLSALESGYGQLERKVRRQLPRAVRSTSPTKVALIAAGIAAIAVGLLRR